MIFQIGTNEMGKYAPVGVSIELGGYYSWIGSYSAFELNMIFTDVLNHGGIYHLISHPAILDWENEDFHWIHLEHISNRKNIWYVGFGHLYSYHFLQSIYPTLSMIDEDISSNINDEIDVGQNYPNPFNPTTNINYKLHKEEFVKVIVYDVLGNIVDILLKARQLPGDKSLQWDATNKKGQKVNSGVYFFSIETGILKRLKK